jgi:4-hydroxybenzoate-CoA ligase
MSAPARAAGRYNAAVDFLETNIAAGRAHKIAFIDPLRTLSFGELRERARRAGPLLARFGIGPENRVVLALLDTVEYPVLFWGAIHAGVVPVLINTRLTVPQYRYLLEDSRARAVFVSPAIRADIAQATAGLAAPPRIIVVGAATHEQSEFERLLAAEAPGIPADTCADEVAYWLYSSGTTGMPKGVMHVHSTPRHIARLAGDGLLGIRESDVCYSTSKMYFAYGLCNSIICPMAAGATAVLHPERPTPTTVFATLRTHQPTIFYAVPTLYAALLADAECRAEHGSRRLRLCVSAGEPLPRDVGLGWKARYGVDILNGVGSTELNHLFLANRPDRVEYGTAGTAVAGYELRLLDDAGHEVGVGEIGELLVKGPTAASGYWNQRERTRRTFQGEWVRTGDKYLRREDGVYVFCGRADDLFKVGGIWVSPHEVEAALTAHPLVLEAAVVAAADAAGLIKPKAYVVLKERGGELPGRALYEELKVHVKRAVGPWKYPRWIEFVEELPRTASGKLQRQLLRSIPGSRP